jgi:hypothetical protein
MFFGRRRQVGTEKLAPQRTTCDYRETRLIPVRRNVGVAAVGQTRPFHDNLRSKIPSPRSLAPYQSGAGRRYVITPSAVVGVERRSCLR